MRRFLTQRLRNIEHTEGKSHIPRTQLAKIASELPLRLGLSVGTDLSTNRFPRRPLLKP